ncbi:hypothetical protein GCM10029964_055930 [Kibdelosporangium lantanae]
MQELPVSGAMFAVDAAEDVVRPLVGGDVEIAAVNGPSAVVVSGAEPATKALAARLAELGHRTTRLKVSHAFHSALMRPIVDELALAGQSLVFGEPSVPGVSTVTGGRVAGDWGDAGYWARQVVEPVLFGAAVASLVAAGVSRIVEIGPGRALTTAIADGGLVDATALLSDGSGEVGGLLSALAVCFTSGVSVDWTKVIPAGPVCPLPTYPFQHVEYWPSASRSTAALDQAGDGHPAASGITRLPEAERRRILLDAVRVHMAAVLGRSSSAEIEVDRRFSEQGLDSVAGTDLQARLTAATGLRMERKVVFQYDTPSRSPNT